MRWRQAWSSAWDSSGSVPAPPASRGGGRAGCCGLAGVDLPQQRLDQVVLHLRAGPAAGFGDGQAQLPLGHSGEQVTVLDRLARGG
ncbi:hypothetical protein [Streptosporangium vulgare]|uniref:hypothetical protein n=1 Tax=Streptosporangium vulgare TaxID=46190 RepID=UPI0031D9333F